MYFASTHELKRQGSHINKDGSIGNLLDGYGVSSQHTEEYVDGSLRLLPIHQAYRQSRRWLVANVADHLPISGRFVITRDDD